MITELISYNPQRLLTDQRSVYQKLADNPAALAGIAKQIMGEPFRLFPHQEQIAETFATGGFFTPTGRRPSEPEIQYLKPADEIVVSRRREPTFRHVDYSRIEQRVAQSLRIDVSAIDRMSSSFAQASAAVERFNERFSRMRAQYEAAVINGMFAVYIKTPPRRPMTRSERIEYLMRSKDPRQRKRGARMAKDEFRRVFGDLPSNWNRSTHRMDFETVSPSARYGDIYTGEPRGPKDWDWDKDDDA